MLHEIGRFVWNSLLDIGIDPLYAFTIINLVWATIAFRKSYKIWNELSWLNKNYIIISILVAILGIVASTLQLFGVIDLIQRMK